MEGQLEGSVFLHYFNFFLFLAPDCFSCVTDQKVSLFFFPCLSAHIALGTLGFGDYKEEAKAVLQEAKAVAAKKRRGSTRLENLGIPEEELLRQQQELFEKVRLHEVVDFQLGTG